VSFFIFFFLASPNSAKKKKIKTPQKIKQQQLKGM
jgi:hypothetical protein